VSYTVFAEGAFDPTASAGWLAWQRADGSAVILRDGGLQPLPGTHPALGGDRLGWRGDGQITIAAAATAVPLEQHPAPAADALALGDGLLAWRTRDAAGRDRLWVLGPGGEGQLMAEAAPAEELGRPAIAGGRILCHVAGPSGSRLLALDPGSGARTELRHEPGALLSNPAGDGLQLLYVRATGRDQQVRLGPLAPAPTAADLTLLVHPSSGQRDAEHERHRARHKHGRRPPPLPPRAPRGVVDTLWTTALAADAVYVTRLRAQEGFPRTAAILRVPLGQAG
jgi:hypothetical protein